MSNPFKNWSPLQVAEHNAKVRPLKVETTVTLLARNHQKIAAKKATQLIKANDKSEAMIQEEVAQFLRGKRAYFVWHRLDQRTTCAVGTPDFVGFSKGFGPFCLEVKKPGCKETREQAGQLFHAKLEGAKVAVVHSVKEAEEFFKV